MFFFNTKDEPKQMVELFDDFLERDRVAFEVLKKTYNLNEEETYFLYRYIWTYTFGVAALVSLRQVRFTDDELNDGIGTAFQSCLMYVKSGRYLETRVRPEQKDGGMDGVADEDNAATTH